MDTLKRNITIDIVENALFDISNKHFHSYYKGNVSIKQLEKGLGQNTFPILENDSSFWSIKKCSVICKNIGPIFNKDVKIQNLENHRPKSNSNTAGCSTDQEKMNSTEFKENDYQDLNANTLNQQKKVDTIKELGNKNFIELKRSSRLQAKPKINYIFEPSTCLINGEEVNKSIKSKKKVAVNLKIKEIKHSRTKKPTLKYLKGREDKLTNISFEKNDDAFLNSSIYKLKNNLFNNLCENSYEETLTFTTPKAICNNVTGRAPRTPRTDLLQAWGSTAVTPSLKDINQTKKQKKSGVLEVLYHHLKDKPNRNRKPKRSTQKVKKNNLSENINNLQILSQTTQESNMDSSIDDYFNDSECDDKSDVVIRVTS